MAAWRPLALGRSCSSFQALAAQCRRCPHDTKNGIGGKHLDLLGICRETIKHSERARARVLDQTLGCLRRKQGASALAPHCGNQEDRHVGWVLLGLGETAQQANTDVTIPLFRELGADR